MRLKERDMEALQISTGSRTELIDITGRLERLVAQSEIEDGLCCVYVPHTTAAVTINENADPSVRKDILNELNKVIPFDDRYAHLEGNSAAHIKASLVGPCVVIPVQGGRLALGTWQGIYLCEFDGPRSRKVHVSFR